MAVVQGLVRDLRNALHRPGHPVPDGVVVIEHGEQVVVNADARVVLAHADLLGDDALLLLYRLRREIGGGDKVQQHTQVFLKALGTLKIIAGDAAGGEGVGVGPVGGENAQGVFPVGQVEHLVFQKMGHARRGVQSLPVHGEAAVGAAVIGGKDGIGRAEAGLGDHPQAQAVGQRGGIHALADIVVFIQLHLHPPPPGRCPSKSRSCRTQGCLLCA